MIARLGTVASRVCAADEVLAVIERRPCCTSLNLRVSVLDDSQAVFWGGWNTTDDEWNVSILFKDS
jgi:hypothetical protein